MQVQVNCRKKLRHAQIGPQRELNLPFDFPGWLLNSFTIGAFNEIYFRRHGVREAPFVCDFESFFFPLDRIGNWNRMYGRRGFVQYQCVMPPTQAAGGLKDLLDEIKKSGRRSFLAVLKRFGRGNEGMLSFPIEGYTLTLDFPISDPGLFPFLDRLDNIVLQHGGRVYLAKDARLQRRLFSLMYPRLNEWLRLKSRIDPDNRFDSDLARRLGLRSGLFTDRVDSHGAVSEVSINS
jgi:FAD/FMN-containing dehydrogenase